jgi:glutamine phosphoribosylpyrophosphate amidotransferase
MCGIFGIANYSKRNLSILREEDLSRLTINLLEESEIRGTDASGICILSDNSIGIFKDKVKGSEIKNFSPFKSLLEKMSMNKKFKSLIGHTRAQTKGSPEFNENNHPIIANKTIGIHNGIINNDDLLFNKYKNEIEREGEVDSEIIFRLIDMYISNGESIVDAVKKTSKEISGSYACAFINLDHPNYLTIFKGLAYPSVYIYEYSIEEIMIFASSSLILDSAIKDLTLLDKKSVKHKFELGSSEGIRINVNTGKIFKFDIESNNSYAGYHSGIYGEVYGGCALCEERNCKECPYFTD